VETGCNEAVSALALQQGICRSSHEKPVTSPADRRFQQPLRSFQDRHDWSAVVGSLVEQTATGNQTRVGESTAHIDPEQDGH
jgi:hypothetical protein